MFEPEELMARIVDLEAQLKVSEMAPPAAEQLIACLEGEIAKRDARIVELEECLPDAIDVIERLRAELAAAPAAPAADAGLVAVEWAKDAEEWGPALNKAGWLFLSELNEDPQKSALIFNSTKGPLRAAIMKYAELVAAHCSTGVV